MCDFARAVIDSGNPRYEAHKVEVLLQDLYFSILFRFTTLL